ncbi:MAG TPA: hypothetical protein VJ986_14790 [Gaiellaceae bacterium]|nr:hypothetical protein [Gaiellaceae bacterium]
MATFVGAFAGMLLVCVVAVGQLARIDAKTLPAVLVVCTAFAAVAAWRSRRT